MKNKLALLLALTTAGSAHVASAFTYTDTDLMLVFRKDGFNDVEFNIGSVSNLLSKSTGTTVNITNWNLGLTKSNFNNSLTGVKYVVVAATLIDDAVPRVWASASALDASPTDMAGSRWRNLRSKISTIGFEPAVATGTNGGSTYVIAGSDVSSYTFNASEGGTLDVSTICGFAPYTVEADIPGTNLFFQLKAYNATPRPAAPLIGYFTLDGAGVLKYTAGPLQQQQQPLVACRLTSVVWSNGLATIRFSTTNAQNYRLWFLDQLGSPWAWSSNVTTVPGDGTIKSLTDNASGSHRFYRVEALH